MRNVIFIRLLALLLTISVVSEITAYLHYDDVVTIETDTDGEEEEESKEEEDKLKEYYFNAFLACDTESLAFKVNSVYLFFSWSTPVIDNLTPPPELA